MKFCPYCHNEAGTLGAGSGCDEVLDYCHECEMIIEGETVDDYDSTPDEESEPMKAKLPVIECPMCKEIALTLQDDTTELEEWICEACNHYQTMTNVDFDPTPDEESEPPFTWKDRSKLEKPR